MSHKLFIAPHPDDETLFGAFTLLGEKPLVVVVTDSTRQNHVTAQQRREETYAAMYVLGNEVAFLGVPDVELEETDWWGEIVKRFSPIEHIWAPANEPSHNDHMLVARGIRFDKTKVTRYLTYDDKGKKQRSNLEVPYEHGWLRKKLQALACYESQIDLGHFVDDLREYYL